MKFRDYLKELDQSHDGKVKPEHEDYFETEFKDVYEIDYDKEGFPTVIHRRDLENITAQDLAIIKRWVEWHNTRDDNDVVLMATDVTRDLGVSLTRK